jgi:hypothetical protein
MFGSWLEAQWRGRVELSLRAVEMFVVFAKSLAPAEAVSTAVSDVQRVELGVTARRARLAALRYCPFPERLWLVLFHLSEMSPIGSGAWRLAGSTTRVARPHRRRQQLRRRPLC